MRELYIDTAAALTDFSAELQGSEWLAVDTEFMRERTYYPQLCLVQIANEELAACIDPLAIEDLTPLLDRLYQGETAKLFHAAGQDLEIFHYLRGDLPQPLFDTQLGAGLIGHGQQVSYAAAVEKSLGVQLEKSQSRTDWTQRPLSEAQVEYALDDVRHLGPLYMEQREQLVRLGRDGWLEEDFERMCRPETYAPDPENAWKRLRSIGELQEADLPIAQALANWREQRAMRIDRPRRWVLADEVVLRLAAAAPATRRELENIEGMPPKIIERQGEALLEAIETARELPRELWPEPLRLMPLDSPQKKAVKRLMNETRETAEREGMDPGLLATRKDVTALVLGARDLAVLRGWREDLLGRRLLALLEG